MPQGPVSLSTIRTDIRSHVSETSAAFWSDAELNRWINEALRDIARRTLNLQAQVDIPMSANKGEYNAPTDMIQIHRVAYRQSATNETPLEYVDPGRLDDAWMSNHQQTGTPRYWTMWGWPSAGQSGQIKVYPVPSSATTLSVWYYRFPNELLADSQPIEIPAGWHDLIPLYVEIVAKRKDKDQSWRDASELYENRLINLNAVTRHWSDQERFMSRQSYALDEW